jgi:hypothetical protein
VAVARPIPVQNADARDRRFGTTPAALARSSESSGESCQHLVRWQRSPALRSGND